MIAGWLKTHLATIRLILMASVLICTYAKGHHDGAESGAVAVAKQSAKTADEAAQRATAFANAVQVARADEQRKANAFAGIDAKFQGDLRYAQALSASTVAGLHAGTVRLSATWRCPAQPAAGVSRSTADSGSAASAGGLRYESAGRIIGYVQQLQAERNAALDLLEADRK